MAYTLLAALGVVVAVALYRTIAGLRKNIAKARKTGLVYIVTPVSPISLAWQLTFWIWVPLIKLLPKSQWERWLFVMLPEWGYSTGQKHFEMLGSETFLVASPTTLQLYTQSAEVIHTMTQRREIFPKDVAKYTVLDMFGSNVLTTEGALWRMHRKITSASFNEKNAAHTFAEAISQTRGMLDMWFGPEGEKTGRTGPIRTLEHDTMTWALNIIGYVGFGLRLLWPGQSLPKDIDPRLAKYGSLKPPAGHTLTFADSVALTLERIVSIMILPESILRILPFKFAREAYKGKINYLQYMDEFLRDKADETLAGAPPSEGMDIMGHLVQSSYTPTTTTLPSQKKSTPTHPKLTDSEIIGNAFIMIVAGHETTANTLHFTLLELANNPAAQRRLQRDIDALLGTSDPSTWDYERLVSPLLASHVGACVNETLRLMPPVTGIPKVVTPEQDQVITIDGKTHVLPAGLACTLVAVCAQRNPRWWPTRPSERTGKADDLDEFLPERWYRVRKDAEEEKEEVGEDYGGFQGSDVSAALYRPVRGSYIPFSDGPRSCLGRRIAMVEMGAVLAVIFQGYSIELDVGEWAGEKEVEGMGAEERREVYRKAQEKSRAVIREADSILTLKLHGGRHVPVRFVKRGGERFVSDPMLS
ncbi:cytochrome P450 [Staphylotrichum tortipilum]|uniref:Cytochrome P450 n=1 Tax=Staphylotrichum tortipilum TaxID=2831512 RepID=A0AAN6RUP9_9PEZI|nr:cytochrome P450 [Staphylotrichum longicolle]